MLAPKLTPGEDQADPAAQLAAMLDQATSQLPPGKNRRPRVAGLIAIPDEPINEDMQTALADRQVLIEIAARNLVREAQEAGAAWVARLGKPPAQPRQREQWLAHAATVALYRHRHNISATSPLGGDGAETTTIEISERRAAHNALTRLRQLARPTGADHSARREPTVGGGLHL